MSDDELLEKANWVLGYYFYGMSAIPWHEFLFFFAKSCAPHIVTGSEIDVAAKYLPITWTNRA